MAKYIDAESLQKEVKRLEKAAHKSALGCADSETRKFHEGKDFAYQHVGILIDSLQQERPEVDLEKEIDDELDRNWRGYYIERRRFVESVKYFYNLGLNARKV